MFRYMKTSYERINTDRTPIHLQTIDQRCTYVSDPWFLGYATDIDDPLALLRNVSCSCGFRLASYPILSIRGLRRMII